MEPSDLRENRQRKKKKETGESTGEARFLRNAMLVTLGRLTGFITHEIHNSMHTLRGYAELAKMDPSNEENVRLALDATLEKVSLLEGQMRFLSGMADSGAEKREVLNLSELVQETTGFMGHIGRLKECVLCISESGAEHCIFGSRRQVQQLVIQLLLNAADATDGKGNIDVSVRALQEAGMLELKVSDNGRGVPEEQLENLFEVTGSNGAGLLANGIGLELVQQIASRHKGRLCVDSVPGTGSRFSVLFPLLPSDPEN